MKSGLSEETFFPPGPWAVAHGDRSADGPGCGLWGVVHRRRQAARPSWLECVAPPRCSCLSPHPLQACTWTLPSLT